MKRFLIVLMLLLATSSVALAKTPSMAGVTVKGNVVRYTAAWKVGKKADGTMFLFKRKIKVVRQVLVVSCKCSTSGACYLEQFPDRLECKPRDCTGTCKIKLDWVTTTDPIEIETP